MCNIRVLLEKKIFKGLHYICYVQIVFGCYFYDNVGQTLIKHTQGLFVRLRTLSSWFGEEDL